MGYSGSRSACPVGICTHLGTNLDLHTVTGDCLQQLKAPFEPWLRGICKQCKNHAQSLLWQSRGVSSVAVASSLFVAMERERSEDDLFLGLGVRHMQAGVSRHEHTHWRKPHICLELHMVRPACDKPVWILSTRQRDLPCLFRPSQPYTSISPRSAAEVQRDTVLLAAKFLDLNGQVQTRWWYNLTRDEMTCGILTKNPRIQVIDWGHTY